MATEKKPSIYSDRSTIGSSNELDEYGVWVKSEPQDLSSVSFGNKETAVSSLPDFDTGLEDESFDPDIDNITDLPDLEIPDYDSEKAGGDDGFSNFEPDTIENLDDTSLENASFDDFSIPDDIADESAGLDDSFTIDEKESEDIDIDTNVDVDVNTDADADADAVTDASAFADESAYADIEEDRSASFEAVGFTEVSMDNYIDDTPAVIHEAAPAPTPVPASAPKAQSDLSTQLLMKIAEELSSIRTELTSLKKEFGSLKAETSSAEEKGEAQHGGFFNEEEDEKIALTGDELDNILNTADFTEEAGEDATEELEGEFTFPEAEDDLSSGTFQLSEESSSQSEIIESQPDMLTDQDDIIGIDDQAETPPAESESPDTDAETPAESESLDPDMDEFSSTFDETDIEDSDEVDLTLDQITVNETDHNETIDSFDESLDSEELKQLRTEGVTPITSAPEDTSYLDEDPLSSIEETDNLSSEISLEEDSSFGAAELNNSSFEIDLDIGNDEFQAAPEEEAGVSFSGEQLDEHVFDESSLDLSDAVIDEPDLSSQITENPLSEPSLDTLDELTSGIAVDNNDASIDTMVSFDSSNDLDQVIPEGFVDDTGDVQVPFDDDFEMEEVDELDDLGLPSAENIAHDDSTVSADTSANSFKDAAEQPTEKSGIPMGIKNELKIVLSYMDQLLESLPEEKIEEFAKSEYFDTYKKLFKELGLA